MESITLNREQQRRAEILTRLSAGRMTREEAAQLLGLSDRQVRRVLAAFQEKGLESLVHGNKGRTPVHRTSEEVAVRVLQLAGEDGRYHDFSAPHLQEILAVEEGIRIGRSTLDRFLREQGVRLSRKQRRSVKRKLRKRSSAEGILVQIDGSPHDWLEGRGPKMTLIGAIDDATGKILFLIFRPTEDQIGYLLLFRTVAQRYGLPQGYYHDRHTMLRSPKEATIEEELAGTPPQSQLQRVLSELGVASIAAHSPQAKGRVERLWQTLQDRLVKEMRVAGVKTLEEANAFLAAFLERFNARFAVPPEDPQDAWTPIRDDMDLAYYFSLREERVVRSDHTLSWQGKPILVLREAGELSLAGKRVTVHTDPEGHLYVYQGKQRLRYQVLGARPAKRNVTQSEPKQPTAASEAANAGRAKQRAWLYGGHQIRP